MKRKPNPSGHGPRKLLPQHKIINMKKSLVCPTRLQADFLLKRIRHGAMSKERRATLQAFLKRKGIGHSLKDISKMASKLLKNYEYEAIFEPGKFAVTPKAEAEELKEFRRFLKALHEANNIGFL